MRILFLSLMFFLFCFALEAKEGDVSIFVLQDGKPLSQAHILIDGKVTLQTDKDGFAASNLPSGKHQALIEVKENQKSIAFVRHNFIVAPDQNTEVIITLSKQGKVDNIDNEASSDVSKYVDSNQIQDNGSLIQTIISGQILSSKDKKPIANARLFVKGSLSKATTDAEGKFSLKLAVGKQTISIIHHKYTSKTFKVTLEKDKKLSKSLLLDPAGIELEEFVVLKPKVEGSVASVLNEKRNETSVSEIMGSEQMTKAGDSKASDALTRVTGVTLVDGKYVYVRGLGERYTTISLNGFFLPSPNPLKRTVPLDIFPTGVLKSIKVQKSATADRTAEFAGGLVELRTKNVPDDFFIKIGISSSYDQTSTFKDALSYEGGGSDMLGYDDGSRSLPVGTPGTSSFTSSMGFNNNLTRKTFMPGMGLKLSFGDSYKFRSGAKIGYFASANYRYDNDITDYDRANYSLTGGNLLKTASDTYTVSKESASLNAMFGLGVEFSDNHKVNWTNLYLHKGTSSVRDSISVDVNAQRHNSELIWTEGTLLSSQLIGEHTFSSLGDTKIDWRSAFTLASMNEPDRRSYSFEYDETNSVYHYSEVSGDDFTRQFNALDDSNIEMGADLTIPVPWWTKEKAKLKSGFSLLSKTRKSRSSVFNYDQSGNTPVAESDIDSVINDATINNYTLNEVGSLTGAYDATQTLMATYGMVDLPLTDSLKVNLGVRLELSDQILNVLHNVTLVETPLGFAQNKTEDMFPSMLVTYKMNEDMQFKMGYARTTSRPDFKELSIALVVDPTTGDLYQGNKELKSALIDNFDLRFEYYMSKTETFSIALFNKFFTNPIEAIIKPSSDGELYSYDNAKEANNQGFEVDIRKNFGQLASFDMRNFYISANYSHIISEIDVSGNTLDDGTGILTTSKRAMQGQSPYVYNFRLGYDNKNSGLTSTLLFNVFGERIVKVGVSGLPDQYEQPVERLDLVTLYTLNEHFKLSFKATNLLNPEYITTQEGKPALSYEKGRKYTFGLNYTY